MTEIERRLNELDRAAMFPPTPDLAGHVVSRIAEAPPQTRGRRERSAWFLRARPALVIALTVVAATGALLAASPAARSAILELLGLHGARIERGQPEATREVPPDLGGRVSVAEARSAAGFEFAIPTLPSLGRPSRIGFDPSVTPGGQVTFAWKANRGGSEDPVAPRVVLTEMRGSAFPIVRKTAPQRTSIEPVTVGGRPGYWLAGAPHQFELIAPDGTSRTGTARLARETLVWERGDLLLRLEGVGSKAEALAIARSIPPNAR